MAGMASCDRCGSKKWHVSIRPKYRWFDLCKRCDDMIRRAQR